jgi:hypothetical protein
MCACRAPYSLLVPSADEKIAQNRAHLVCFGCCSGLSAANLIFVQFRAVPGLARARKKRRTSMLLRPLAVRQQSLALHAAICDGPVDHCCHVVDGPLLAK